MPNPRRCPLAALLLGLALGSACGDDPPDDILDLEVTAASFSNPQVLAGGVAMGGMEIQADLAVTDSTDGEHSFAVSFSGLNLGSAGIWTNRNDSGPDISGMGIELPRSVLSEDGGVEGPVTLRHLFTDYAGVGFGMHVILGGGIFTFSNDADVSIWFGAISAGFGINWGLCPTMQLQLR